MAVTTNGKPQRKQLSDQLDRLDAILDCLAEGLPGAVADAAREGVRQAVKDAITEILTHPELLTAIRTTTEEADGPAHPVGSVASRLWDRLKAGVKSVRDSIVVVADRTLTVGRLRFWEPRERLATAIRTLVGSLPVNRIVLAAALTVMVLLVASAPLVTSAVVVWAGSAFATAGVVVASRVRRAARGWGIA